MIWAQGIVKLFWKVYFIKLYSLLFQLSCGLFFNEIEILFERRWNLWSTKLLMIDVYICGVKDYGYVSCINNPLASQCSFIEGHRRIYCVVAFSGAVKFKARF